MSVPRRVLNRLERRSIAILTAAGYQCSRTEWIFNLVGIGPHDLVLVKTVENDWPDEKTEAHLKEFPTPQEVLTRRFIHCWRTHSQKPDVRELTASNETATLVDRPRNEKAARVYFVEAPSLGLLKIGRCSGNPNDRLSQIQQISPVPLRIICDIQGDARTERELHRRFAKFHERGEWFRFRGQLKEFVLKQAEDGSKDHSIGRKDHLGNRVPKPTD